MYVYRMLTKQIWILAILYLSYIQLLKKLYKAAAVPIFCQFKTCLEFKFIIQNVLIKDFTGLSWENILQFIYIHEKAG